MKEGTGTAARVLEAGDVKLERVLELEKKLVSSSQPTQIRDREGYTPIARKVLENSYREAVRFHAPLIGTEHILMAMLKQTRLCGCAAFKYIKHQYPEALYRPSVAPWEKKEPPAVRSWSRAGAEGMERQIRRCWTNTAGILQSWQQRESWIRSSAESMRSSG